MERQADDRKWQRCKCAGFVPGKGNRCATCGHDITWHTGEPIVEAQVAATFSSSLKEANDEETASFLGAVIQQTADTTETMKQALSGSPGAAARSARACRTAVSTVIVLTSGPAEKWMCSVLEIDPGHEACLIRYGMVLMGKRDYGEAEVLLKRAVALGGANNKHALRAYQCLVQTMKPLEGLALPIGDRKRPKQLVPIVVEPKRVEPSAKYVANVESKEETGVVVEETPVSPGSPFKERGGLSPEEKAAKLQAMREQIAQRNLEARVVKEEEPEDTDFSCGCLRKKNCLRRACIEISESSTFERFTVLVILFNCFTLAMYDTTDKECKTSRMGRTRDYKLFHRGNVDQDGVWGENGYFSEPWNRFDCTIVVFVHSGGINSIRGFRAMRPLRAITRISGLRVLIALIIDSLPMVARAFMVLAMILFAFSVIGLQLWKDGLMRSRCTDSTGAVYTPTNTLWLANINLNTSTYYCSYSQNWGLNSCPPSDADSYTACKAVGTNPFGGVVSFDNIFMSWLTVFITITVETWSDIQYVMMETHSLFFVPLILLGNFFGINLFLVIVSNQFGDVKRREYAVVKAYEQKRKEIIAERQLNSSLLAAGVGVETVGEVAHTMRHQGLSKFAKLATDLENEMKEVEDREMLIDRIEEVKELEQKFIQGTASGQPGLRDCTDALRKLVVQLEYIVYIQHSVYSTDLPPQLIWCFRECSKTMHRYEQSDFPCCSKIVRCVERTVTHEYFNNLVMFVILLNTIAMAATHHGQSASLDALQSTLNTGFVVFFLLEMLLKHVGLGFGGYWSEGWNRFDGIIVIASVADMVFIGVSGGGSWVSVFRALRLMRVFKMIKFLPAMQKQLEVLTRAIGGVGYLGLLLGMLLFIFAILGMTLFGNAPSDTSMRPNFDELSWSMLTVLSVVTLDNWTVIMSDVVRETSGLAALYFVALIVLSRFFLYNLFIAVILQAFAEFRAEEEERLVEELNAQRKANKSAFELLGNVRHMHVKPKARIIFNEWKAITQVRQSKLFTLKSWKTRDEEDRIYKKIRHHLSQFKESFCAESRLALRNECFRIWKDPSYTHDLSWGTDLVDANETGQVAHTRKNTRKKSVQEIIDRAAAALWEAGEGDIEGHVQTVHCPDISRSPSKDSVESEYHAQLATSPAQSSPLLAPKSPEENDTPGQWCSDLGSVDANNDGVIDMTEWKAAGGTEEAFKELDTNNDEGLDVDELEEVQELMVSIQASREQFLASIMDESSEEDLDDFEQSTNPLTQEEIDELTRQAMEDPDLADLDELVMKQSAVPERTELPPLHQKDNAAEEKEESAIEEMDPVATAEAVEMERAVQNSTEVEISNIQDDVESGDNDEDDDMLLEDIEKMLEGVSDDEADTNGIDGSSMSSVGTGSGGEKVAKSMQKGKKTLVNEIQQDWEVSEHKQGQLKTLVKDDVAAMPKWKQEMFAASKEEEEYTGPPPEPCYTRRVLCCFSETNCLRLMCHNIVKHPLFDKTILFLILANSCFIAYDRPEIEDGSAERWLLDSANGIFVLVFSAEMLFKIMAYGLYYMPDAYLRSGWNRLDGFVVVISWVYLAAQIDSLRVLRVLRLIRTIRPLRAIQHLPALRLVCNALIAAMPPVGHVMLICTCFMTVFAILGVQLFAGAFYSCNLDGGQEYDKQECEDACSNCWTNSVMNFDHVGNAALLLFWVAIGDWNDPLLNAVDSQGVDKGRSRNNNILVSLYFVAALLVFYFFLFNMFLGVLQDNYSRMLAQQNQTSAELADARDEDSDFDENTLDLAIAAEAKARQKEKRAAKKRKIQQEALKEVNSKASSQPANAKVVPEGANENAIWFKKREVAASLATRIVTHQAFDATVALVICANVVVMSLEYYRMDDSYGDILTYFAYGFVGFFVCEAIFKFAGLGFKGYFADSWNLFDFVVVLISIAAIVIEEVGSDFMVVNPSLLRCMRLVRIMRMVKLIKVSEGLQAIMSTLSQVMGPLANLLLLMLLLVFVYACAGVELFGRMQCTSTSPCEGFGPEAKFTNFLWAMFTLFRVSTADGVPALMRDAMRGPSDGCDDSSGCDYGENCCALFGEYSSPIYFVSFVALSRLVVLNIVVVMMIEQFDLATEDLLLEAIRLEVLALDGLSEEERLEKLGLLADDMKEVAKGVAENMSGMMKAKVERDRLAKERRENDRTMLIRKERADSKVDILDGESKDGGSRKVSAVADHSSITDMLEELGRSRSPSKADSSLEPEPKDSPVGSAKVAPHSPTLKPASSPLKKSTPSPSSNPVPPPPVGGSWFNSNT